MRCLDTRRGRGIQAGQCVCYLHEEAEDFKKRVSDRERRACGVCVGGLGWDRDSDRDARD